MASKKHRLALILAGIFTFFVGCNANNTIDNRTPSVNRITEIRFSESVDSWNCIIKGSQRLTFTAINQVSPTGVLLHFPDTHLELVNAAQLPKNRDIITSIDANEIILDTTTTTRIWIGLKVERPYGLSPDENGLKVSFPKTLALAIAVDKKTGLSENKPETKPDKYIVPIAKQLNKVTATSFKNNIIVKLEADGIINAYKSFSIDNPARIVFDCYHLKSPYKTEQIITVESKWVKQIRYFTYPNKIRLVLDTYSRFLSKYVSFPVETGLIIYIGRNPKTSNGSN